MSHTEPVTRANILVILDRMDERSEKMERESKERLERMDKESKERLERMDRESKEMRDYSKEMNKRLE